MWAGFENGAFSGAISGAIFGGLGGAGQMFAGSCNAMGKIAGIEKIITSTFKISGGITSVMGGFDLLSMGLGVIDPNNPLTTLNQRLHSSKLYNGFQFLAGAAAAFSGGAYLRMKQGPPACFVAGTMILTAAGLVAIENITTGDKVIATDPVTRTTSEKTVVETYIREVPHLVHIKLNNEEIKTTVEHPFYVKEQGFVKAGELQVGDLIVNAAGGVYAVEEVCLEVVEKRETVYNFQVGDFHTYYVGDSSVLVHNANYPKNSNTKANTLAQNRKNGRAYEKQEFAKFSAKNKNTVEQVTVKTSSGVRTRVDAIGLDSKGNVVIREFKSSATAPLTKNQAVGFPQIFKDGAVVVGKGKGIFKGGFKIPKGTDVRIIRP